ncbi:MAG: hypothetical protein WBA58_06910, partial [Giesbergeria sp.]
MTGTRTALRVSRMALVAMVALFCRGQIFSDNPIGDFCKFSDLLGIAARTEPVSSIPAWNAVSEG